MSKVRPRKEGQHNQAPLLIVPPAEQQSYSTPGAKPARPASNKLEDKLIKSGQLTLPRILSLAAIAGFIVAAVSLGGVWLSIGYWVITLGFCLLLILVAMDYGVELEEVFPDKGELEPVTTVVSERTPAQAMASSRSQPRAKRQTKRRRY